MRREVLLTCLLLAALIGVVGYGIFYSVQLDEEDPRPQLRQHTRALRSSGAAERESTPNKERRDGH